MIYHYLFEPFYEFMFMRNALLGAILLSFSACPVGVFLVLRGMSLTGDAMSHAILPGVAAGFLLYGFSMIAMTIGGIIAGLFVAMCSVFFNRKTVQKEDATMAVFYLMALAVGVLIISLRGSSVDLLHLLFGSVLAITNQGVILIAVIAFLSCVLIITLWRALIAETMDPLFFGSISSIGKYVHAIMLMIMVINLVAGFQSLGTLLSVGLMMIPAITARFWASHVSSMCVISILLGGLSSILGLVISYHAALPSGPAIILCAGAMYLLSALLAPRGLVLGEILFSKMNKTTDKGH
ncbi:metal ABC transporter permease [Bartonella tamiae]|uniref:Uncharacterized protein n=1 Tax=Bartonella tamiae Th239 TaxID=1094558 RepID=J1JZK7_9HYPH|nr:metal ABC transporter permease [Bartonella tamiae]EJF90562.1 hypothetical protein ME5_00963 [Bartonella tamiae Th239]EJF94060.1 hypothetical protein MEG_00918 [Bartonella tamiae Th307]